VDSDAEPPLGVDVEVVEAEGRALLPNIATRARALVQYRAELETVEFEFLYDRVSRTGVHVTFEVRRPEEETDRIDFDDDEYFRREV